MRCKNCKLPKDYHGQKKYCPQSYGTKTFEPDEEFVKSKQEVKKE